MASPIRRMRWTHVAIILSVALNLFLVAFLGAQIWRLRHPGGVLALATSRGLATGAVTQLVLRQLIEKLPPADAAIFRNAFAARLPEMIMLQRQSIEAMEQARTDIARLPYDNDKVRADLNAGRAARQKIGPLLEETLLDILPRMSEEGRRTLSEYRLLPRQ